MLESALQTTPTLVIIFSIPNLATTKTEKIYKY